jgi:hypothetical protein
VCQQTDATRQIAHAVANGTVRSTEQTMLMQLDKDLELDFIREFAVGGDILMGSSVDDRRERIRVAIYRRNLVHEPFRDSGLDYGQAYLQCYGRPIELRRTIRHEAKSA